LCERRRRGCKFENLILITFIGTGGDNVWCDYFQVQVINQCALIAIADGCNWGVKPKKAAETACKLVCDLVLIEILLYDTY
jgi:hypothetical protein